MQTIPTKIRQIRKGLYYLEDAEAKIDLSILSLFKKTKVSLKVYYQKNVLVMYIRIKFFFTIHNKRLKKD